jgi:PAS domain S-box-containing protein
LTLNSWQHGLFAMLNLAIVCNVVLIFVMRDSIVRCLTQLVKISGEPVHNTNKEKVIKDFLIDTKSLLGEVHLVMSRINEIGQEQFTVMMQDIKHESIRAPLLSANDKIIALRKKEQESNWITQGVASVVQLKHKGNDIAEFSFQITSNVVKYLDAHQGAFFLLKGKDEESHFELTASYAYGKKKFVERIVNLGEGLIGQVYYEKSIIHMTDLPKDYVKITSGLGEALPTSICIVPLLSDGVVLGVIEIASFNTFDASHLEYLRKIGESIGYTLSAIETHRRTEILLEESQKMAQEVKSQEEELRQNMEELTATQTQMRRKEIEMDAVLASLCTVELDLYGNVIYANPVFLGITGYGLHDIQNKLYKSLIPQHGNDPVQYEIMWHSILSGRSFSGEFRIVNKDQKEMWMAGNFTPILDDDGKPYKIMVISLFTTQDKEKLYELNEVVTAIKSCFPIAEINMDMTFKTANDLFLSELGIKRIELKKSLPKNVMLNGSYNKVERFIQNLEDEPDNIVLDFHDRNGIAKRFNSTLIKIGNTASQRKKGLLILRNEIIAHGESVTV